MSTQPTVTSVKLCELDSLVDGGVAQAKLDGIVILYARVADEWFAIDDTCSHAKVSLADGIIDTDDLTIECPKHGALFSLSDGSALTLPAINPVTSFPVEVTPEGVFVNIASSEDRS